MSAFADLFDPPLKQWALRGDPRLWARIREGFADKPLPDSAEEVRSAIEAAFLVYVGQSIDAPPGTHLRVPSLVTGRGMSDGQVVPEFWRETAVPLIVDRWMVATGRESQ